MYNNTVTVPEVVMVSPDIAREMLTHNTHNRNAKSRFHEYAVDMANGDWRPDLCDPLRFDEDGVLLDGQNRLLAVIESEVSIPFLVVRGLPRQTQSVMDSGVPRKFADILTLRGEEHPVMLAAVTRLSWEWTMGPGYLTRGRATHSQLVRFIDEHPEIRVYSTQHARTLAASSYLPASIIGTLWWVFAAIDEIDADYFFKRLGEDTGHSRTEPIYELRRTLKATAEMTSSSRSGRSRTWLMAITIKAWNAYRNGDSVSIYRWRPGGAKPEEFPEPK